MLLSEAQHQEINVLLQFNLSSMQEGIKVHSNAEPDLIAATCRLFEKGLITQEDGGYLTSLGHTATEHAQALKTILSAAEAELQG
ncbi:TIGR02647 family protein [Oceanospirillum linum]|uniref:TIGR02647 family protein n=1 Tax=Oceanospirillum linum TaxID=966 RepID=A0A1T1HEE2_OCELI|nr:TIGR02647 family protein [Oceanospirillum linum]OOV88231.1 TIGR02647 family protein [Oceanospirillum linum]SEF49037.1 TIGR02647 family protein [Oleiphilus messinensis]SMP03141.1 TIGR02647 family protein [Oceanospirillum linum]